MSEARWKRSFALGVITAALLGGCSQLGVSSPTSATAPGSSDSSVPTSSSTSSTSTPTTTTLPKSFGVGVFEEVNWVNHGASEAYMPTTTTPYRALPTFIFYPAAQGESQGGAAPVENAPAASAGAPYPVIVFAHGDDQLPSTYGALIDAWVEAGFVVVAPVFPGENRDNIDALGGWDTNAALDADNDVVNEPGDIAFVIGKLAAAAADQASRLHGLVDLSKLSLAGQSDGGNAVAALVYNTSYATTWSALPVKPRAVAVLSGALIGVAADYRTPLHPPAELSVESTGDYCNSPPSATALYDSFRGDKWFLTIDGATHMDPYVGQAPWAAPTAAVTSAFLELELGWRLASAARAAMAAAGNEPSLTALSHSEKAPTLVEPPPSGDPGDAVACGFEP
jgi:hypothetical protein